MTITEEKTRAEQDDSAAAKTVTNSANAAQENWGWTPTQRAGLGILLAILLTLLIVQYLRRPARLGEGMVTVNGEPASLPRRVDVNTASVPELMRIPHIGEKLAAKIVEYREARKGLVEDGLVFHRAEDLSKVGGMGKSTLELVKPYLDFPGDREGAEVGTETQP
jgi:competence ComEA-like helix-hairpin-helix protein